MKLNRLNQLVDRREVVDGTWRLTRNYELIYRRRGPQEKILLRGHLVSAQAKRLQFQVSEDQLDGQLQGRRFSLRGRWQADAKNRLAFVVEGQRGRSRWLVLQGAWQVGKRNEIVYRIRKTRLKTRTQPNQLLRFQGVWKIGERRHLTYVLDARSNSQFRFRGTFQSPSVLAKRGEIRYQLGVEARLGPRSKILTLFGKWKFSRRLGLTFEMPASSGAVQQIHFGATFSLGPRGSLAAKLKSRKGQLLGLEVIFSRNFLARQGETFVRLKRVLEETVLEGGVRIRW